ncbi:MAG: c-type cytochrome [Deltaproteobacteria bacterium]|nr:MAG: c-type cytochrome [Deltaproteobacteria bacterium]
MVQYNFTARQRQDLIAFFKWISEMDLNGFPPKPNLAKGSSDKPAPSGQPQTGVARRAPAPPLTRKQPQPSRRATSPSSRSATRQLANAPNQAKNKAPAKPPTIFRQLCIACHSLHGQGGKVGPALDHVGRKYTPVYLQKWLTDPQAVKPGTQMPKLPLSKDNLTKLVEYLSQLK